MTPHAMKKKIVDDEEERLNFDRSYLPCSPQPLSLTRGSYLSAGPKAKPDFLDLERMWSMTGDGMILRLDG